eukprot:jgi/Astpho2/9531/gw1.00146.179.1_t
MSSRSDQAGSWWRWAWAACLITAAPQTWTTRLMLITWSFTTMLLVTLLRMRSSLYTMAAISGLK